MKIIRNYAIPYLIFLILILLDALFSSHKKSAIKKDVFITESTKKNYTARTYYSKLPMAILDSGNSLLNHPTMVNFYSPDMIGDNVSSKDTQVQILPPNQAVTIYTTKDPKHHFLYLFQYKDKQGVLDIRDEKKFAEHFGPTQTAVEIDEKLQAIFTEVNNHKDIHLDFCVPYRDYAFSEFGNEPLPQYHLDIISNRNQQFYEYKLAAHNLSNFIKVSGYEIRGNDKEKEQCFKVVTKDLKYYFISYNLIR